MPLTKMMSRLCLLVCAAVLCVGCSSAKFMADQMGPLLDKMNEAVNKNTDVELVKDALPASLVQMDGIIEASPDNRKYLAMAAEAYNGYSFVFVEDTDRARAGELYQKSFRYALRVLKQKKKFAEAFDGPQEEFEASLSVFGKEDVPALFWTSSSWLSWAGLNVDDPEIFLALPKIKAMLNKCIELDETYKYGAAHVLLGVLYASRPVAHGGKPELAKAEFDRAFEISNGKMLLFYLMYAKYYAYQVQDKELYVDTLNHIIKAPDNILPQMAFINTASKEKAVALLEDADNVF